MHTLDKACHKLCFPISLSSSTSTPAHINITSSHCSLVKSSDNYWSCFSRWENGELKVRERLQSTGSQSRHLPSFPAGAFFIVCFGWFLGIELSGMSPLHFSTDDSSILQDTEQTQTRVLLYRYLRCLKSTARWTHLGPSGWAWVNQCKGPEETVSQTESSAIPKNWGRPSWVVHPMEFGLACSAPTTVWVSSL